MEGYHFPCKPLANPASIIRGAQYRFTIIDDQVLRYEWAKDGVFEDRASIFALNRNFPPPAFRVEDADDQLKLITPALSLTYDTQRFSAHGFHVSFTNKLTLWGAEWRYGTPPAGNLGGTARTLDGVDGRCDVAPGILSTDGYAVLDDSESMLFDGTGFVATRRPGDRIDGYIFAYGRDFKGAMRSFYAISGSQPSIPRWALGNWWSRYYAYRQTEYLALMDKFRDEQIPLSVAVVDMDWHVVQGDEVPHSGWTGYSWNRELFPDPEGFMKALHDRGLRTTLNDHPHAGVHAHEDAYEEMAAALDHDTTHKAPILFDPTSPKYMHAYLNVLHRKLERQGCDFWWIDWQQGAYSHIPGIDPLWLLNHFQYLDQVKTKSAPQALVFSRYAGPGSHRYPIGFSGDSRSTWDSLAFQPEFTAMASNIGYGWWSHDLGGHFGGSRDDELLVRWVQQGVFSPIFRLHSSDSEWNSKEPWLYRREAAAVIKRWMQFRHRLVPYIYSMMDSRESRCYLPLVQPLYWSSPTTDAAYRYPTQYSFGSSLIVSPVLQPRDKRTNLAATKVWVPPGRHVDILTGTVYDGDREMDMYRSLDTFPLLAREGSIIPLDKTLSPANGCRNPSGFEVIVVVGQSGSFDILENCADGQDAKANARIHRSIPITFDQPTGRVRFPSANREWTFRFATLDLDPAKVNIHANGSTLDQATSTASQEGWMSSLHVTIPPLPNPKTIITVDLGPEPVLTPTAYLPPTKSLLRDFQIAHKIKDTIWGVVRSDQHKTIKASRLISLDLNKEVLGPILEVMLADSREA